MAVAVSTIKKNAQSFGFEFGQTHGGKIPRARCCFDGVFHTGRKLKRGNGKRNGFF